MHVFVHFASWPSNLIETSLSRPLSHPSQKGVNKEDKINTPHDYTRKTENKLHTVYLDSCVCSQVAPMSNMGDDIDRTTCRWRWTGTTNDIERDERLRIEVKTRLDGRSYWQHDARQVAFVLLDTEDSHVTSGMDCVCSQGVVGRRHLWPISRTTVPSSKPKSWRKKSMSCSKSQPR